MKQIDRITFTINQGSVINSLRDKINELVDEHNKLVSEHGWSSLNKKEEVIEKDVCRTQKKVSKKRK